MKVAAMFGDGTGGLVDQPDPQAKGDFVIVKILVAPMCTEYKSFGDGGKGEGFGHEAAGEVVEAPQKGQYAVGDRVVVQPLNACGTCWLCAKGEYIHCQNSRNMHEETGSTSGGATYAQYTVKPDYMLSPIPDDVSIEHGGMAVCGLGPTFGAMQQMQVDRFDTVMITGMGPVGLGGVINGTFRGASVIAVESHSYRANLAKELGAELVVDPIDENAMEMVMDFTSGGGVDKAMDCSGVAPAHRFLIDAARRKGQVSFIGEAGDLTIKISQDMIRKGLVLRGNWHYNKSDYPKLLEVIRNSKEKLDQFITHQFPMSEVQKAWELQITGNCGKVVLDPWA